MLVALVIILIVAILGLIFYNMNIYRKLQKFNNINQKLTNLSVLQDFMNIIGQDINVNKKLEKINDIIIAKYDIKYSSIIIFDGTKFVVKASNVDEKHWEVMQKLHQDDIFKDSVVSGNSKYISAKDQNETLTYQKTELARAKSAIFFPMYIDNIYIGFWIIESDQIRAFDNADTSILDVVKENIISAFKSTAYQNILEKTNRIDLFTGLNSKEYLFSEGKKNLNNFSTSTVSMFNISNIVDINNKISREAGNKVITDIAKLLSDSLSKEYLFIRYMGPKFVIVFYGVEPKSTMNFITEIKDDVEKIKVNINKDKKIIAKAKENEMSPILSFALTTYYKGTGIEEVTQKLEDYLDNSSEESFINII